MKSFVKCLSESSPRSLSVKEIVLGVSRQGTSMRRRFVLCLVTCLIFIIGVLFMLLNLLGVINPADDEFKHVLSQQLDYSSTRIFKEADRLAAYAVEFSEQMSTQIEDCGTEFDELRNNYPALYALQSDAYATVLNNMRLAQCSGAFFMLNTTVNDGLEDNYYSGLYLKYANVGSATMLRNSVCMFRGISHVARANDINLFSTWECELKEGTFPQMEAVMSQLESDPVKGYLLTPAYKLPDAWESVRLLCAPISDSHGRIIGVCGFEISDPFFQSMYAVSDAEQEFVVCGLLDLLPTELDEGNAGGDMADGDVSDVADGSGSVGDGGDYMADGGAMGGGGAVGGSGKAETAANGDDSDDEVEAVEFSGVYSGQIAPNRSAYAPVLSGDISVQPTKNDDFLKFSSGDTVLIGKARRIQVGNSQHIVASMIPETQYDNCVNSRKIKTLLLLLLITLISLLASLFLSRQYVKPLVKSLEQIKASQYDKASRIAEIDDLFNFLSEQDRLRESAVANAEQEKADALAAISEMQEKYDEASRTVERLAYSRRDEIDPEDYQHFLAGIERLTPTEKKVLEFYMARNTLKDIIEITGLKESTIRFHNRNIYAKLGVNSLKQLLRYAAVMQNSAAEKSEDE